MAAIDGDRAFQVCPSCSDTIEVNDPEVARFIQRWGCLDCRTWQCDREHYFRQIERGSIPFKASA